MSTCWGGGQGWCPLLSGTEAHHELTELSAESRAGRAGELLAEGEGKEG